MSQEIKYNIGVGQDGGRVGGSVSYCHPEPNQKKIIIKRETAT